MTWALNHLNYFALTHLLLDAVKSAPAGRIVNVSSAAHLSGRIRFDDPEFHAGFAGFAAYSQSTPLRAGWPERALRPIRCTLAGLPPVLPETMAVSPMRSWAASGNSSP
jgi:NAD(P)-dependent dehydrogenase (short-subunit alcohol dehydrogenase family)